MAGFTHSTTKRHVYGCSVPRLTRLTGSVCMEPGRKNRLRLIHYRLSKIFPICRHYSSKKTIFYKNIFDLTNIVLAAIFFANESDNSRCVRKMNTRATYL